MDDWEFTHKLLIKKSNEGKITAKEFADLQKALRQKKLAYVQTVLAVKSGIYKQEEIANNLIYGTFNYRGKITDYKKAVLLIPGFSANRYQLSVFATRLVQHGYLCLTIDLPSHFKNPNKFTLGTLGESIIESVKLLKNKCGIEEVAIIGHSMGAVGSILGSMGYTRQVESELYSKWGQIVNELDREVILLKNFNDNFKYVQQIHEKIDSLYSELSSVILSTMKNMIPLNNTIKCMIALAPPSDCKAAFPGIQLLKNVKHDRVRKLIHIFLHKPAIQTLHKEEKEFGYNFEYFGEDDPRYVYFQFFKTKDVYGFIDYLSQLKEPEDYISLIQSIAQIKHKDGKVNPFEYYQKKYMELLPKLFVYGSRDFLLRPFMPGGKKRLEQLYTSCGNAKIISGNWGHVLTKKGANQATMSFTHDKLTMQVLDFVDKHLKGKYAVRNARTELQQN